MAEPNTLIALGQQFGISALLFIIFIVYNSGEQKKWGERERNQSALYESIITQIRNTRADDLRILNDTLTDNRIQLGMLKETLTQIENLSSISNQAFRDMFAELKQLSNRRCAADQRREAA
jgi:hypothetical protein